MQRRYALSRFRWAVWRYAPWIVGAIVLVAALIAVPRARLPLLIVAAAIVLAWLLTRALFAGFVERGLVHQRRRYLRGWTRDLTAAEMRLQPEMILAVMALEHQPDMTQPEKPTDAEADTHESMIYTNGAKES
jgi:hypothetical protein